MFDMWSDLGEEPITAQGAQSKRPQPDAPVQQPMRAGLKPAQQRKPSADQKRIRRQMAKNASVSMPAGYEDQPMTVVDGDGEEWTRVTEESTLWVHSYAPTAEIGRSPLMLDLNQIQHQYGLAPKQANSKTSSTTPTKESNAMTQHTEQDLIARLASATSMAEQTDLQNQIEAIRATRRDTIAMEGSLDWDAMGEMPPSRMQAAASHLFSGGSIEDLPPATASTRLGHTEGTDWLMDVTADVTPDATLSAVARSEATLWFTNLWGAVKQDRQEFTAQAHNAAASSGSQFGLQATAGKAVFLDQVKHLASREGLSLIAAEDDSDWVPLTGSELRAYLSGESKDEGIKMIDGKAHKKASSRHTAGTYAGGSPKSGDTAKCHKDGKSIEFFDGQWMHLNSDPAPSHNDVHPGTPKEIASGQAMGSRTASRYDGTTGIPGSMATCSNCNGGLTAATNGTWLHDNNGTMYCPGKSAPSETDLSFMEYVAVPKDVKVFDNETSQWKSAGRAFIALDETVDTYVSDGKTTQPVGVGASDNMDSFSEWTIGTDLNHDDPKSTDAGTPSLAEGDTPEGDKAEGVDNPNYGVGPDKSEWAVGNTDDKMATQGGLRIRTASANRNPRTAVSLTNVGIDGENGVGTKADGTRVTFRLTPKELSDLKGVLYSDMAVNFSGVDIEESDIIKSAAHTAKVEVRRVTDVDGAGNAIIRVEYADGTSWVYPADSAGDTSPPEPLGFSSSLADRMAAEFGNSRTAGIQTFTPHFAQEEQSGTADGLSSADAASEAPSMKEGDAPETGHQESFTQTPGEGAQDLSGPTDSDRPGGGVEWTGSTSAAKTASTTCKHCGNDISKRVDPTGQRGEAWTDNPDESNSLNDTGFQCGLSDSGKHEPGTTAARHTLSQIGAAFEGKPVSDAVRTLAASLRTVGSIHDSIGTTPVKVIATALANSPEVPVNVKQALRQHLASATCSVCGDAIAKDPSSEDPSTYHHDNGEKHDHEAKPGSESKEGQRAPFGRESNADLGMMSSPELREIISAGGEQAEKAKDILVERGEMTAEEHITASKTAAAPLKTCQRAGCGATITEWKGVNDRYGHGTAYICAEGHTNYVSGGSTPFGGTSLGSAKTAADTHPDGTAQCPGVGKGISGGIRSTSGNTFGKVIGKCPTCQKTVGAKNGKVPAHAAKTASLLSTIAANINKVAQAVVPKGETVTLPGGAVYRSLGVPASTWSGYGYDEGTLFEAIGNGSDGQVQRAITHKDMEIMGITVGGSKHTAAKGNDFSLSDAKNDEGEWIMSPEQIRAEMAYDPSEDEGDPYREASKTAAENAGLGVGHIWYETKCPAYTTLNGADCTCNNAPGAGTRQSARRTAAMTCPSCKQETATNEPVDPPEKDEDGETVTALYCSNCDYGIEKVEHQGSRKQAMPNPVENGVDVGAIFYSSWGYDQTNVDFYEVVGVTGASVKIIPIDKRVVEGDGSPSERVMPVKGSGAGLPQTKRLNVSGTSIYLSLNSFSNAYLWDGKPKNQTGYGYGH